MKVKELITLLSAFDPEMDVAVASGEPDRFTINGVEPQIETLMQHPDAGYLVYPMDVPLHYPKPWIPRKVVLV